MEKITYAVKAFRLAEQTFEQLKDGKKESGTTWNLYFVRLLKIAKNKAKKYDKQ